MKQRIVIAMLALLGVLGMTGDTYAQVKVELVTGNNWTSIPTCPRTWKASGVITISEFNMNDFWDGSPQVSDTYFDLKIALPPGLEFDPTGTPATWTAPTSANLQNGSGTITMEWNNVGQVLDGMYPSLFPGILQMPWGNAPTPSSVNTLVLNDFHVKNVHKLDVVTIINANIRIIAGSNIVPSGNLYAWVDNVLPTNLVLPSTHTSVVRGLPTDGIVNSGTTPPVSYYPVDAAEGIVFVTQPATRQHDVQERITGSVPSTFPTVQAIDCNGNATSNIPDDTYVNLTLLDEFGNAVSSNYTLWDGVGPTYAGATITKAHDDSWDANGKMPLTFSVNMQWSSTFKINAAVAPPFSQTIGSAASNSVSSSNFSVAQRPIAWTNYPVFDDPIVVSGGYNLVLESNPKVSIADLVDNDPAASVRMMIREGDQLTYGADDVIVSDPSLLQPLTVNNFYVQQSSADKSVTFTAGTSAVGFETTLSTIPEYWAYVFVPTNYYGHNNNQGTALYMDPRYAMLYSVVNNGALPVELTTFTASLRNQMVSLKWSTATETNNYGFDVERSEDGATWTKIGFVAGNGTTSSQHDYGFSNRLTETDMMRPTLSYRLRQIDRDGTFEYSPVVTVALAHAASSVKLMQNFPNPFNPSTNISFNLPEAGTVTLTVYNELGVEVARIHDAAQFEAGWHTAAFNASALPSGLYSYRLSTPAGSVAKTMIVTK